MPVDVQIQDADVAGFSDGAKKRLKTAVASYGSALIEEAKRIEAESFSAGGTTEITPRMVDEAKSALHRVRKPGKGIRALRVLGAALSLFAGSLYDATAMQKPGNMLFYIIVIAVTILVVTVSTMKE